jgi:hypothetical protein
MSLSLLAVTSKWQEKRIKENKIKRITSVIPNQKKAETCSPSNIPNSLPPFWDSL